VGAVHKMSSRSNSSRLFSLSTLAAVRSSASRPYISMSLMHSGISASVTMIGVRLKAAYSIVCEPITFSVCSFRSIDQKLAGKESPLRARGYKVTKLERAKIERVSSTGAGMQSGRRSLPISVTGRIRARVR
jgi:hypothetical protein